MQAESSAVEVDSDRITVKPDLQQTVVPVLQIVLQAARSADQNRATKYGISKDRHQGEKQKLRER